MRNSIFKLEVVTYEGIVKYPKELDFDHLGYFRNPLQAENQIQFGNRYTL